MEIRSKTLIRVCVLATVLIVVGLSAWGIVSHARRANEVIGRWTSATEGMEFGEDGEWDGWDLKDPGFLNRGGSWTISGSAVTLETTVIDPPLAPDMHATLSKNGKVLTRDEDNQVFFPESNDSKAVKSTH